MVEDDVEELGLVELEDELGLVELEEEVLGEVLAVVVELLELGDVDVALVLGVVALVVWSSIRVGSVELARVEDLLVEEVVSVGVVVVEVEALGEVDEDNVLLLVLGVVLEMPLVLGVVLEKVESLVEMLELGVVEDADEVELGLVTVAP